ncbi:MAG: peptidylprolyl isomerase, partial [Lachnospiraceae bacterium]|nr:peptidylprolyl isomerase [Lachnospiraceae bacterium]
LICGGIGGGAMMALDSVGIKVYAGASGNTDECVAQLLAGTLPQVGEANCDHHGHHDHEEGHDCDCHGHHDHEEGHECGCHGHND